MSGNKLSSLIVILSCLISLSTPALADCDLKLDIKQVQDGFLYTNDCHRLVGKTFMDKKDLELQVLKYEDLLKLSEEQIRLEQERAELWRGTSMDLNERVNNMEWLSDKNKLLYFGAGAAVVIGSAWAVGQASK